MEKEFTIPGKGKRLWKYNETFTRVLSVGTSDHAHWNSSWWCDDGDGVELSIDTDGGGFELDCFSGIPASSIYIDVVDFGTLWRKAFQNNFDVGSIANFTYTQQCIMIADYLCGLFCEYTDVSVYKTISRPEEEQK